MSGFNSRPYHSQFSMKANFEVAFAVFVQRTRTILRYKAALFFDIITPSLFALFPILIGNSLAGSPDAAASNFNINSGTEEYILYMVIGANLFQITNGAINNFAFYLRKEQMQGTLESLYLTPVNQFFVLLGTAFYTVSRALVNFFASLAFAGIVFGVNPFTGDLAIGFLFLIIGGFSFGVIIYLIQNKDWDLYAEMNESFASFVLLSLPYLWFVLLALFFIIAYFNFKHTKSGYKFKLYYVLLISIILSIGFVGVSAQISFVFSFT